MTAPRTDRRIDIAPNRNRVRVTFAGKVIADTTRALALDEENHAPVQYIPRADVDMSLLARTAHASHCPFKGDAAYYSIDIDGRVAENAVWTYERPYPYVAKIKDHLAFYGSRVDAIEETTA
jgi:uncharacterized protein (DUF427 family)